MGTNDIDSVKTIFVELCNTHAHSGKLKLTYAATEIALSCLKVISFSCPFNDQVNIKKQYFHDIFDIELKADT